MRFGVIRFPGSCDDVDAQLAASRVGEAVLLWHADRGLQDVDAVIVPGGFSYGDYLRVGAIARFAPVMEDVIAFAREGGPVLGICNGFQVLCEAGLLPGALLPNTNLKFTCRQLEVEVVNAGTSWTSAASEGEGRVVFRYADGNPNGSSREIAGVTSENGRVVGLMPHPEHAVEPLTGSADGLKLFLSAARVPAA